MTNQFKLLKGNGVLASYVDTIQEAMSVCDRQQGWYFEKKGRLTKEELHYKVVRLCVNKQLEPYGVTYDDVKKGGDKEFVLTTRIEKKKIFFGLFTKDIVQPHKIPWYQYYTFNSEQEFNEWKEFCINLFKKEFKLTDTQAAREFAWFNLSHGLKQNYEVKI